MTKIRNIKPNLNQDTPLIHHIEILSQLALKYGFDEKAYIKDAPISCATIQQFFGDISLTQSILFAVIFTLNFKSNAVDLEDISRVLKVSTVKIFALHKELDDLVNRQILRIYSDNRRHTRTRTMLQCIQYYVSSRLVESLWRDETTFCPSKAKTANDVFDLFDSLDSIFQDHVDEVSTFKQTINEIKATFDRNSQLPFVTELKVCGLEDESLLIFVALCSQVIEGNEEIILPKIISALFPCDQRNQLKLRKEFIRGVHELQQKDLLQLEEDGSFRSDSTAELTERALQMLLPDDHSLFIKTKKISKEQNIIIYSDIKPKELFFDDDLKKQLDTIAEILQPENYHNLISRLDDAGMPKGIAILFHGLPGTGKSECCFQLARKFKRHLYMVNISETKSLYFGESEKRVKKIFDTYRKSVEDAANAPILVFNEADAVLGTRKKIGHSSVDQTENTIQNILLQEMEDLNGIMICTTNLITNLDSAFDRRFLFKVLFGTPVLEARIQIWLSHLPNLSGNDAKFLAEQYDFSGGAISNIGRKCFMKQILKGSLPILSEIIEYCDQEALHGKKNERTKIGFIR